MAWLVWTRCRFGCLLPRLSPFELPLGVFFIEGDVQSLLQDPRHMLLNVLHTHDFGQSLELLFEAPIGREPEVEHGGPGWLEDVGGTRRQLTLAQRQLARRGRCG